MDINIHYSLEVSGGGVICLTVVLVFVSVVFIVTQIETGKGGKGPVAAGCTDSIDNESGRWWVVCASLRPHCILCWISASLSLSLSAVCGYSKQEALCKPGGGLWPEPLHASTLISDFQLPEL